MSRKVYFDEIEHGVGGRASTLYACLYDAETGELAISADMNYCLEKIEKRGYIVVRKPETKQLKGWQKTYNNPDICSCHGMTNCQFQD